jgi:hypothetical protein
VCYKSEMEGKYLYLIDGALSAFNFGQSAGEGGDTPVPPCIQQTTAGTVQVALEIEDKVRQRAIHNITADEVTVQVQNKAHHSQEVVSIPKPRNTEPLNPTLCHPNPFTLFPTLFTLSPPHPTLYTLCPAPQTLHSKPTPPPFYTTCTLNASP